jgi:2-iminobutanoate/2-iminopropanoate deaminase
MASPFEEAHPMTDSAALRPLPQPGGHYRHAVRSGSMVFASGQLGWDDEQKRADGIAAQTRLALSNLERALASEGAGLRDLVSVTVYLSDLTNFAEYNAAYKEVIGDDPPTRASIGVALPEGCLIEISGIAIVGE